MPPCLIQHQNDELLLLWFNRFRKALESRLHPKDIDSWQQQVLTLSCLRLDKDIGGKTRSQDFTPLGTWLTIVPVEGIGFREEKTLCLSAFLLVPNKPSFNWDRVAASVHL